MRIQIADEGLKHAARVHGGKCQMCAIGRQGESLAATAGLEGISVGR
jgi:hypothetical protein